MTRFKIHDARIRIQKSEPLTVKEKMGAGEEAQKKKEALFDFSNYAYNSTDSLIHCGSGTSIVVI